MNLTKKLSKELNKKERKLQKKNLYNYLYKNEDFEFVKIPIDWNLHEEKFLRRFHKKTGKKNRNKFTKKINNLNSIRYIEIEE